MQSQLVHASRPNDEVALLPSRSYPLDLLLAKSDDRHRIPATHEGEHLQALQRQARSIPFSMAFQPIVDVQAGRILAYEALTRGPAWRTHQHRPRTNPAQQPLLPRPALPREGHRTLLLAQPARHRCRPQRQLLSQRRVRAQTVPSPHLQRRRSRQLSTDPHHLRESPKSRRFAATNTCATS